MIEGDCGGDDGTLDGHVIEALTAVTELPRIIADLESDRPSNTSLVLSKIIGALRS